MTDESEKHRRSIRNYLINPKVQLRFYVPHLIMLFLFAVALNIMTYYNSNILNDTLAKSTPDQALIIGQFFVQMVWGTAIVLAITCSIGGVLAIVTTHRLIGPLVSIVRHIQALQHGDYSQDLKLRRSDELHFLAEELNKLTEKLRESGKSARAK